MRWMFSPLSGGSNSKLNKVDFASAMCWVISARFKQAGSEPTLGPLDGQAAACSPIVQLVVLNESDAQVPGFGMGEIISGNRCSWENGFGLGQCRTNALFGIEQRPNQVFVKVVRAGGVPRRRSNSAVGFFDEFLVGEVFFSCIAPCGGPYVLVQPFRHGFGQAISDSLHEDGLVIIAVLLVRTSDGINAVHRDREATNGIGGSSIGWGNEICQ